MFQTHPILDSVAPVSTQHFFKSGPGISHRIIKKTQPSMKVGPIVLSITQEGVEKQQL